MATSLPSAKGAFHRVAGILAVEHAGDGIRVFNLHPGFVSTERMAADMAQFGFDDSGAPPDVVAAVAVWLATDDDAVKFNGQNIAQVGSAALSSMIQWKNTGSSSF